jgi:hypothetical protein
VPSLTPGRRAELEAVQRGQRVRYGYAGRWERTNGDSLDSNQLRALTWLFANVYIDTKIEKQPVGGVYRRMVLTTDKGQKALQAESPTEE